jgi:hypothetical protein
MQAIEIEPPMAAASSNPTRRRTRKGSAVTSGRRLLNGGDPNSAWSRRYRDLMAGHISDLGGQDQLSVAQLSLCRRAAALENELERLEAKLSNGDDVDLDRYGRAASHLRRLLETLGLRRVPRDVTPTLRSYLTAKSDPDSTA